MPERSSKRDDTLRHLQEMLLEHVLQDRPLPGQSAPVRFPDLAYLRGSSTVLVDDEHAAEKLTLSSMDRSVEVLSFDEIRKRGKGGDQPYAHFRAPQWGDNHVRIILDVRMAPPDKSIESLGLGAISVTFVQEDGDWLVREEPAVMAM